MKNKAIVFIEDKYQVLHYLRNRDNFQGVLPIVLSFDAEKTLDENGINFRTDDDYETPSLYGGLYLSCLKKARILCNKLDLKYRDINLFELFYSEIFKFLAFLQRYSRLVEKIIKTEKPNEIYIFENNRDEQVISV